jgi:hypothetical protein
MLSFGMLNPVSYGRPGPKGYYSRLHRKLTVTQVNAMRTLWAGGLRNYHELARRFKCDRGTVKAVVEYRSWVKMPPATVWDAMAAVSSR